MPTPTEVYENSLSKEDKDARKLTRAQRLGRTGLALVSGLVVVAAVAPMAKEGASQAASAIGNLIPDGPTDKDVLHDRLENAKQNPDKVEPKQYVTYIVGENTVPEDIAESLAKKGSFDTIKNEAIAQEDANGNLQQGPIILDRIAVDMQDAAVSTQVLPFPLEK